MDGSLQAVGSGAKPVPAAAVFGLLRAWGVRSTKRLLARQKNKKEEREQEGIEQTAEYTARVKAEQMPESGGTAACCSFIFRDLHTIQLRVIGTRP